MADHQPTREVEQVNGDDGQVNGVHGEFRLGRAGEEVVDQLLEVAGSDGAEFVAASVVDEQGAVDIDHAAGEADAAVEAFDFVVFFGLEEPSGVR